MRTTNRRRPRPTTDAVTAPASRAPWSSRTRRIAPIVALCLLVALAGVGGYLIHPTPAPAPSDSQVPAFVPLPAQASLVRTERFLKENIQNWYYSVPRLSEEAAIAFYQSQLPQKGWKCVTSMTNTNMSYYGQVFSGTGVYITALRGSSKAQIYVGDQGYGAWLLQDDLPDGAIALRFSLEPAKNAACS